ncbi:MAG: division/cell wall cluster transcriptional repressor MraZ [Candidatus Woesebacteria bacterium]|jgi:MraZ protein
MLIGQYKSKLTDKNRLAVPAKFRQQLGETLIVAKWYENCLVLVSKDGWEDLLARLVGVKETVTSPVRDVDRFILGSAFEVSLDSQGRFVLPDVLRDFSDIEEEVVFVGLNDRIEIWSRDNWDSLEKEAEQRAARAIEETAEQKKNGKRE